MGLIQQTKQRLTTRNMTPDPTSEPVDTNWNNLGVYLGSESHQVNRRLVAGLEWLDKFFEGGISQGTLIEWGVPFGLGGRELIATWLAGYCREERHHHQTVRPILWAYGRNHLIVNPPAWAARGVPLKVIRFTHAPAPIQQLKAVFLEPTFPIIFLDAPTSLRLDDCGFLVRQARRHGQTIFLLRDYFLSEKKGNIWAKVRVNCWYHHRYDKWRLKTVRGLSAKFLEVDSKQLKGSEPCSLMGVTNP